MTRLLATMSLLFVVPRAIADGNGVFVTIGAVLVLAGLIVGGN